MATKEQKRIANKIRHRCELLQESLIELIELDRQHTALSVDYGLREQELSAMMKMVDATMARVLIDE